MLFLDCHVGTVMKRTSKCGWLWKNVFHVWHLCNHSKVVGAFNYKVCLNSSRLWRGKKCVCLQANSLKGVETASWPAAERHSRGVSSHVIVRLSLGICFSHLGLSKVQKQLRKEVLTPAIRNQQQLNIDDWGMGKKCKND